MSRENPVYRSRIEHYRELQQRFSGARSGDPAWLRGLRDESIAHFAERGFPSTRLEEWRYTNVAAIAGSDFELDGDATEIEIEEASGSPGVRSLKDALASDADSVRARLARAPEAKDRSFAQLNSAFLSDGAVVSLAAKEVAEAPIQLRVPPTRAGAIRLPRLLVELAPESRATLVLVCGGGAGLTNLVADFEVGANASLEIVLLQASDEPGFQVTNLSARLGRDARFRSHTLSAGGTLVRNDLDVVLAGEGSECHLRGLFLGREQGLVDNHSSVDHAVPHCSSHELYKGILADRAKGVFRGRVLVRPDAQKTDATQSNPNLLLGAGAEIDTKPQLEIYADDVKCSHGATVGQLEPDALFYLQSRGIGRDEARRMLLRAFASEILEALPEDSARDAMDSRLDALLASAGDES